MPSCTVEHMLRAHRQGCNKKYPWPHRWHASLYVRFLQNPSFDAHAGGLGAVFRTVLETMRTLFVWLVDLLLFYTPLGLGKLGESWSSYSLIQAAGCAAAACKPMLRSQSTRGHVQGPCRALMPAHARLAHAVCFSARQHLRSQETNRKHGVHTRASSERKDGSLCSEVPRPHLRAAARTAKHEAERVHTDVKSPEHWMGTGRFLSVRRLHARDRFVVLVSGTLVYSKGDAKQAEAEAGELHAAVGSFDGAPASEVAPLLGGAHPHAHPPLACHARAAPLPSLQAAARGSAGSQPVVPHLMPDA